MTHPVRFQGKEYLLVNGREDHDEGAIATQEQLEACAASFAHLYPDGRILRYGVQIGTAADLEFLEEAATPKGGEQ